MRVIICSEFFCEPHLWQRLEVEFLPPLLARGADFRAWSIGCYTGKEPFSLAILLDSMGHRDGAPLLATDKDPQVLALAVRGGPFTARDVDNIVPEQRANYLIGTSPRIFVRPAIRRRAAFRLEDVARDAPPHRFDLVLYRNVEPFFDASTNQAVCARIFAALRPGGVMFCSSVDRIPGWAEIGFEHRGPAFFRRPDA